MNTKAGLAKRAATPTTGTAERIEGSNLLTLPRVGEWYWVKFKDDNFTAWDAAADDIRNVELGQKDFKYSRTEPRQHASYEQLCCVIDVGSNYVAMKTLKFKNTDSDYEGARGGQTVRIHLDKYESRMVLEPDASSFIQQRTWQRQKNVAQLMGQVQEITRRLGIGQQSIGAGDEGKAAQAAVGALVRVTSGVALTDFKAELTKAKEKTLPQLFRQLKAENNGMATWMTAELLPLKAAAKGLEPLIERIDDRVFNVELYAGLCEQVVQVRKGEAAAVGEPIHLMQRRAYMDEECLADYDAGGMRFEDIGRFDTWLSRQHNLDRLMPHQRCVLAFRVRREKADRSEEFDATDSLAGFIALSMAVDEDEKKNASTFLYLRNGEQLFRLTTKLDFGAQLFPDQQLAHLTGKLYGRPQKYSHDGEWEVITEGDYLQRQESFEAAKKTFEAKRAAWLREKTLQKLRVRAWNRSPEGKRLAELEKLSKPRHHWDPKPAEHTALDDLRHFCVKVDEASYFGPSDYDFRAALELVEDWSVFNDDNVHFDEIQASLKAQLARHNRLVLVLQGLLDRSETFHPHPKWELWNDTGFAAAFRLVYDSSRALVSSEKLPDYKAFRAELQKTVKVGSVMFGQQELYRTMCAERYNEAHAKDRNFRPYRRYLPQGDRGPGALAYVASMRGSKVTFKWRKEKLRGKSDRWSTEYMDASFTCDLSELLHVTAYTPGGYKQFFADPRTRAQYLQWAPALLTAEDFHAGAKKARNPKEERDARVAGAEHDVIVRDW